MKLLGLDVGNKWIGVAFGDADLRIATPLDVVERRSVTQDASAIRQLVQEYAAEQIIVGLPRNTDGTLGDQAKLTQEYAYAIGKELPIPLTMWDEHLSTVEASRRTQASGAHGKKSRRNLDAVAAAVILQDYMDSELDRKQNAE